MILLCLFGMIVAAGERPLHAQPTAAPHVVQPGDTWTALAWQTGQDADALQAAAGHPNRQWQPVIGDNLLLPETTALTGSLHRVDEGGLLETAVRHNLSPWHIALQNDMHHPYQPTLYRALFLPVGDGPPRELPPGVDALDLSHTPALPGRALGVRGERPSNLPLRIWLNGAPMAVLENGRFFVGVTGLGAFFGKGAPELSIQVGEQGALWTQPWRVQDDVWTYQQLTLTGDAAAIDQESIAAERERLFGIWSQTSPALLWQRPFQLPINSYLEISSQYGARRSYNGGPYRTYHEGVDFSAYGGTPVIAPAAGTVVVAEFLYVRGGAVIIDHGGGVYSGYYHLSSVAAEVGTAVQPGDLLGEVGTTGLSTGNHLHWDLLVNGVWIDASAWMADGMDCWLLAGLDQTCAEG